jgi:iron uptake system component EfeO
MNALLKLVGIITFSILVAACGSGSAPQGGTGEIAGSVTVSENEWKITFPSSTIKAGKVTFAVKNEGAVEHNFVIEAAGIQIDAIQPGQAKLASAELKPGTYEVLCNIAGHKEAGMAATLVVTQ